VRLTELSLEAKALLLAEGLLGVLCAFRFYEYWTTGYFAFDESLYYRDAITGGTAGWFSFRWFVVGFDILIFRVLGINSIDSFSVLLPFYGFFWSSLVLIALYLILHRLGFSGVTAALAIITSFTAISFVTFSTAVFTSEPVGLALAMWGVYLFIRFYQSKTWKETLAYPFLTALAFGAASGSREPYSAYSLGGIVLVALAAYLKRHDAVSVTPARLKLLLVLSIIAFAVPSGVLLSYPQPIFALRLSPLVSNIPGTVTSVSPSAIISTVTIISTSTTGTSVSTISKNVTVSYSVIGLTVLNFLVGIALGWGPIAGVIGVIGLVIVLRRALFGKDRLALLLLLICAVALSSYLGTSYFWASPGFLSFVNFSAVIRFSNTSLPAFFLAAPFVLFHLAKSRKRYLPYLAVLVIFMTVSVPVYQVFASSPIRFFPGNPFYLSYRTNAVEVRNFMEKNLDGTPAYMLGVPQGWSFTPGVQDLRNLSVFSPLPGSQSVNTINENQFHSYMWPSVYVYVGNDTALGLPEPLSAFPSYIQQLVQPKNETAGEFPFTVTSVMVADSTNSLRLYKVSLSWSNG
jgi:hypothetical protein